MQTGHDVTPSKYSALLAPQAPPTIASPRLYWCAAIVNHVIRRGRCYCKHQGACLLQALQLSLTYHGSFRRRKDRQKKTQNIATYYSSTIGISLQNVQFGQVEKIRLIDIFFLGGGGGGGWTTQMFLKALLRKATFCLKYFLVSV